MNYQPRTIALVAELIHPPTAVDPRPIQKLHNEMFEGGQPAYAGFQVTPVGPVMANPPGPGGAVSQVAFLQDRVQFREERGSMTHEDFASRVREVAERAAVLRNVMVYSGQAVVVRSLVNPRSSSDTRDFLRNRVMGLGDALEDFGRPTELIGLRLGLGAADTSNGLGGDDAPVDPGVFGLRLESWQQDPRSLFVEVAGQFGGAALVETPGGPPGFDSLERNVLATYECIGERVVPFIARFDKREG